MDAVRVILGPQVLKQRILVLGSTGQVGRALTKLLGTHPSVLCWSRRSGGPSDAEGLIQRLDQLTADERPTLIFNAAAYTQVDQAEREPEAARLMNTVWPTELARWCARNRVALVHYSTDYVFSGTGERPWRETDKTAPLNVYGATKREGELGILAEMQNEGDRFLIVRTSWVYDGEGQNFLNTMLRLGRERAELRVVADQWGAPTYAFGLAEATLKACENALNQVVTGLFPSGIYHLSGTEYTSWCEFARAIFANARALQFPLRVEEVVAIQTSDFPLPASRPLNSRLDGRLAEEVLGVKLPAWRESLSLCLKRKINNEGH